MTMNNTQKEAVSTLLEWAKEDEDSRSLLIIAEEEDRPVSYTHLDVYKRQP